jgi:hypothetical protein
VTNQANEQHREPLTQPAERNDLTWKDKAQTAIKARELSKALRQGKPKSFRPSVGKTPSK